MKSNLLKNKVVAVLSVAMLGVVITLAGVPKAQAVDITLAPIDASTLNVVIAPTQTSATVSLGAPGQCTAGQITINYTLDSVAKSVTINNGLGHVTNSSDTSGIAALPQGCNWTETNSPNAGDGFVDPTYAAPFPISFTITGLTAATTYTIVATDVISQGFSQAGSVNPDRYVMAVNNGTRTFTTDSVPVVNPPATPSTYTEEEAKAAAAGTASVVTDKSNPSAVRVNLDPAKFGSLVGKYVHVTGFSTPTDLGSVLVEGTAAAPFATVDTSALPKGTHTLAFDVDGVLIDAVTLDKLVGNTSGSGVNVLAIFALLALAGAGVVAMRKRA